MGGGGAFLNISWDNAFLVLAFFGLNELPPPHFDLFLYFSLCWPILVLNGQTKSKYGKNEGKNMAVALAEFLKQKFAKTGDNISTNICPNALKFGSFVYHVKLFGNLSKPKNHVSPFYKEKYIFWNFGFRAGL